VHFKMTQVFVKCRTRTTRKRVLLYIVSTIRSQQANNRIETLFIRLLLNTCVGCFIVQLHACQHSVVCKWTNSCKPSGGRWSVGLHV